MSQIEWSNRDVAATLKKVCILESSLPLIPHNPIIGKASHVNLDPKITNDDWQEEQANDPHIG